MHAIKARIINQQSKPFRIQANTRTFATIIITLTVPIPI